MNFKWKMQKAKNKGVDKALAEGVNFAVRNYSAAVLLVLKDKFDFDTDQLKEAVDYINETFDSICEGYLTLNDISDVLKEENDIDIRFRGVTNE